MPRKARQKSPDSIYHIMCRSVSEFLLFRDNEDKCYYLELLKRYKEKYKCSIYGYCIMDNHLHLHFDPRGYDVSKFMQSTNTAYVRYYNKKYKRCGHVFQERFESRILSSNEYNLAITAYIHNNAKDISGYAGKEHLYPYSSYGIYLGLRKDSLGLVDQSFIQSLFSVGGHEAFKKRYAELIINQRDIGCLKGIAQKLSKAIENEYRSGRSVILRDRLPSHVISYISNRLLKNGESEILLKSKRKAIDYRAFCAYVMRVLCGLGYRQICDNIYNITISGCERLCSKGFELVNDNKEYAGIFNELAGIRTG